jgi:hypothetical protein
MRTVEPHGTPGQHLVLGLGRLVYTKVGMPPSEAS